MGDGPRRLIGSAVTSQRAFLIVEVEGKSARQRTPEFLKLSPLGQVPVLELPDGKYPQPILFQVTGDRCSELDQFNVGDELEVHFNLRGRFWEGNGKGEKCFVSLDVWRMKRIGVAAEPQGSDHQNDDIPF